MLRFVTTCAALLVAAFKAFLRLWFLLPFVSLAIACAQKSDIKEGPPPEQLDMAGTPMEPLKEGWSSGSIPWEGRNYGVIGYVQTKVGCSQGSTAVPKSCAGYMPIPLDKPDADSYERCDMTVTVHSWRKTRGYTYKATKAANQSYFVDWYATSPGNYAGSASMYLNLKLSWVQRTAPVALRLAHCNVPGDGKQEYGYRYASQFRPPDVYFPPKPWDAGKKMP